MWEYQEQTYTVQHNPLQCQGREFVLWDHQAIYLCVSLDVISNDNIYKVDMEAGGEATSQASEQWIFGK
jgi:hypothetical protein